MSQKVYCPLCKTYWGYSRDRKSLGGRIIEPVKNKRYTLVLTCNGCSEGVQRTADDPETAKDRQLQRLGRLDDEEEDGL